eukprot:TRINITY_DN27383_c0_g1_i1.p1 TRINITY_DN27383_c0_g1~~TRINITY_DN27383_c0_g1_i1.p1  ORF type:complete len:460 (+),score=106.01 TRINITY_DN27383_c0_g1_i1:184-1563(+)
MLDRFFQGGLFDWGPRFSCELKCYPPAFAGKGDLENGNRLILPPSVLRRMQELNIQAEPMLFEVADLDGRRRTHAGVSEFVAPEDVCYAPLWLLRHLGAAEDGHILRISSKPLPRATYVRFRPANVALLRVYNPRALLECGLRNFVAFTDGDAFAVEYNGKQYGLEVLEVHPGGAACVVDTDVQVDFATPLDASGPGRGAASPSRSRSRPDPAAGPAGSRAEPEDSYGSMSAPTQGHVGVDAAVLFTGAGHRIDGGAADGEASAPTCLDEEEEDTMPWRRRIPGGVKYTRENPPFGFQVEKHGRQAAETRSRWSQVNDAGIALGGVGSGPGRPNMPEQLRAAALQAADAREAERAEEFAARRAEVELEARARDAAAAEAAAEAEAEAQRKRQRSRSLAVDAASAQKRKDAEAQRRAAEARRRARGGRLGFVFACCRCFRGGRNVRGASGGNSVATQSRC